MFKAYGERCLGWLIDRAFEYWNDYGVKIILNANFLC